MWLRGARRLWQDKREQIDNQPCSGWELTLLNGLKGTRALLARGLFTGRCWFFLGGGDGFLWDPLLLPQQHRVSLHLRHTLPRSGKTRQGSIFRAALDAAGDQFGPLELQACSSPLVLFPTRSSQLAAPSFMRGRAVGGGSLGDCLGSFSPGVTPQKRSGSAHP